MSEIRHVVEEHHKAHTKRLAFPNAMDFVLEFLNQLMRGAVYGRAKRKDGTEEGLEVECKGCFAVHLRIGK